MSTQQTAWIADVGVALNATDPLPVMLQTCAEAVVCHLDAAFARIWVVNAAEEILELRASAGQYTHLDGVLAMFARRPLGEETLVMLSSVANLIATGIAADKKGLGLGLYIS